MRFAMRFQRTVTTCEQIASSLWGSSVLKGYKGARWRKGLSIPVTGWETVRQLFHLRCDGGLVKRRKVPEKFQTTNFFDLPSLSPERMRRVAVFIRTIFHKINSLQRTKTRLVAFRFSSSCRVRDQPKRKAKKLRPRRGYS